MREEKGKESSYASVCMETAVLNTHKHIYMKMVSESSFCLSIIISP